jgi:hypothetical protein
MRSAAATAPPLAVSLAPISRARCRIRGSASTRRTASRMRAGLGLPVRRFGVPRGGDRFTDALGQQLEVGLQLGELLVGQAVGAAGRPVADLPVAVAFAAAPAAYLHGEPAADLGDSGVGKLGDVKVIDDGLGVRQRLMYRGLEHGAHIDGDVADLVSPGLWAGEQPVDDRLGGTALDLPEQPLAFGQVDQAYMPAVHGGLPSAGCLVEDPLGPTTADLVDAEDPHRLRLGRQDRTKFVEPRYAATAWRAASRSISTSVHCARRARACRSCPVYPDPMRDHPTSPRPPRPR